MRMNQNSVRNRQPISDEPDDLASQFSRLLVGQPDVAESIVPYIQMHEAGLAPDGRPLGVFLLLGPTGTGKTRTVEALAEMLHGSSKNLLKIDCGEFQMEHEVAKLIGAPPGYLGHRETQPMLTQARINAVASEDCDISLILFDEVEKAAASLTRLLLGILDKATLRLGDNSTVNFENCLIFLTSNVGARAMNKATNPDFGFEAMLPPSSSSDSVKKLRNIGATAVRQKFPPEFLNRIDSVITYRPLTRAAHSQILDQLLSEFSLHVQDRLGMRAFRPYCTPAGKELLLEKGTSAEYGARELKRTLHRNYIQPVAALVAQGKVRPGSIVVLDAKQGKFTLSIRE